MAFSLGGVQYAYVVDTITIDTTESAPKVLYASGTLFSAATPMP